MTTAIGVELDAAVLRILGWRNDSEWHVKFGYWTHPTDNGLHVHDSHLQLSTDHNGHEALRLCGPWLDERCTLWIVYSRKTSFQCDAWINGTKLDTSELYDTRAEAIARLVLAIHEQETLNPPRPT